MCALHTRTRAHTQTAMSLRGLLNAGHSERLEPNGRFLLTGQLAERGVCTKTTQTLDLEPPDMLFCQFEAFYYLSDL
jgi:hypothetical protein